MRRRAIVLYFLFMFHGCTAAPVVPPPDVQTGFLQYPELMAPQPDRSPFALNWHVDPEQLNAYKQRYKQIYLAPVSTRFLQQGDEPLSPDVVESISNYFRNSFASAIERDCGELFKIVDKPEGETFVVELALIKLVPTKFAVNVLESAAGIFIPGALPVVAASNVAGALAAHEIGKGRVAMGLKVTDATTGTLIGEAYDEREDRAALLLNARDFTRWGNARLIIQDWASEFTQLLVTPESEKVSRPFPMSVLLW